MAHFLFGGGWVGFSYHHVASSLFKKSVIVFIIAPHIWIYSAMHHALNVKAKLTKLKSSKSIIY